MSADAARRPPSGASRIVLRDYQKRAIEYVEDAWRRGVRRMVLVSPTGSGKGTIAAYIMAGAAAKGRRTMFAVHRWEIMREILRRVDREVGWTDVGVIKGRHERTNLTASVQIASVASVINLRDPPPVDIIIVDECHRAKSESYGRLFEMYPNALIVGTTATPSRTDGQGLSDLFEELHIVAQPSELIAAGHIVNPMVYSVPESMLPDLRGVRRTGGEWDLDQLAEQMTRNELVGNTIEHWLRYSQGLSTLVLAVNVRHSELLRDRFLAAGVPAEHVDGDSPLEFRDALLGEDGRFMRGETLVVCSANLLIEGVDLPRAKCLVIARPTMSLTLHLQGLGRVMRPWMGITPIVLDHAGNIRVHGLPSEDRSWTLAGRDKSEKFPVVECPKCSRTVPAATQRCPLPSPPPDGPPCDYDFVAARAEEEAARAEGEAAQATPEETDDELELLDDAAPTAPQTPEEQAAALRAMRRVRYEGFWARAYEEGFDEQWVRRRYYEAYSEYPDRGWTPPRRAPRAYTQAERDEWLRRRIAGARRNGYDEGWIRQRYVRVFGLEPDPAALRSLADALVAPAAAGVAARPPRRRAAPRPPPAPGADLRQLALGAPPPAPGAPPAWLTRAKGPEVAPPPLPPGDDEFNFDEEIVL